MTGALSHHLLIAGTGRAGTSLLVKYLTGLGLDTQLSRHGKNSSWDESANAGLEDDLSIGDVNMFPYVVKSAWSSETIDKILSRKNVKLDAVIVPVRDLIEAATSRTVIEKQHMHKTATWMADLDQSWESWASTPGGVVYSLNPMDQARLLAVGFHHLIQKLTENEIPVVLLAFPKFANEPEYLFRCLKPFLSTDITKEFAKSVFEKIVDKEKIRVGNEIQSNRRVEDAKRRYPKQTEIDNMALRREIGNLRQLLDRLKPNLHNGADQIDNKINFAQQIVAKIQSYLSWI
jgi:hypothetical protein